MPCESGASSASTSAGSSASHTLATAGQIHAQSKPWRRRVAAMHRPGGHMRANLSVFAIAAVLSAVSLPVTAQDWPTKPVKIVVPFGAGSTPDVVARLIADHLQHKLGQPFVIENKPGASGNTGTDAVAKAEPDGATIGISIGGPLAINTLLFSRLPYDPGKDIAPITQLVTQPSALAVNVGLNVSSVADLVALLRREPGKYNYGSIGNGSLSHL